MTTIQSADIVLVHTPGFSPLRFATGMQYNHVFLIDERIFGDWKIAESINKGASVDLLSNYMGQWLTAYRYRGITLEQQDQVRYQCAVMGKFYYDYFLPFRVIKRLGFTNTLKALANLWSKNYPLNVPHIQDDWVVCSEYAQEAYARAGLPLQDDRYLFLPDSPLYPPADSTLELAWRTDCYSGNPDYP